MLKSYHVYFNFKASFWTDKVLKNLLNVHLTESKILIQNICKHLIMVSKIA